MDNEHHHARSTFYVNWENSTAKDEDKGSAKDIPSLISSREIENQSSNSRFYVAIREDNLENKDFKDADEVEEQAKSEKEHKESVIRELLETEHSYVSGLLVFTALLSAVQRSNEQNEMLENFKHSQEICDY